VAAKPKKNARYDLKAADRKRNLAIQIGLTSIVVIFAVVLVGYIVMSNEKKPASGESKSIRVTSSKLVNKEGTSDPRRCCRSTRTSSALPVAISRGSSVPPSAT